jgi:hypothetical protein
MPLGPGLPGGFQVTAQNLAVAPLELLTRAATHPERQCRGGNALLRCAYLGALLRTDLRCVITQVYDHAPRLRAMRHAGFELTPLHRGWDSEAQARTQPLLAWMLRERVAAGVQTITTEQASALQHTAIDLPAISASLNAQWQALAAQRPARVAAATCP